MNYLKTEEALRKGYREGAAQYRKDDEIEVTTRHHQRIGARLSLLTASFGRPISVLDAGCGTGRYFHCLRRVKRLVGMDISPEMLAAARSPVLGHEVTAEEIELRQGNVFLTDFAPGSFDFIYSFGMFGHGCPVTTAVCDKFHTWLAPGGCLVFDTIDLAGLPRGDQFKKRARQAIYPLLPAPLKAALDRRQGDTPFFGVTKAHLERILAASQFRNFEVRSELCETPLWTGRHLECVARRGAAPVSGPGTAVRNSMPTAETEPVNC